MVELNTLRRIAALLWQLRRSDDDNDNLNSREVLWLAEALCTLRPAVGLAPGVEIPEEWRDYAPDEILPCWGTCTCCTTPEECAGEHECETCREAAGLCKVCLKTEDECTSCPDCGDHDCKECRNCGNQDCEHCPCGANSGACHDWCEEHGEWECEHSCCENCQTRNPDPCPKHDGYCTDCCDDRSCCAASEPHTVSEPDVEEEVIEH